MNSCAILLQQGTSAESKTAMCGSESPLLAPGFRVAMEMPSADYAIVERDDAIVERDDAAIHLRPHDASRDLTAGMHIFAAELDGLYAKLQRRSARVSQGVPRKPWGNREFRVGDLFGNEIKLTEPGIGR